MQSHARAVVVGGGCVGAGILYGLAKRGWTDVVMLERTQLTAGSTWHAAGLIPSYARSHSVAKLINRSIEIYSGLEAETGQHIGWHPCGQLRTASSKDRVLEYKSYMDVAAAQGANAHLLTAEEVREIWPLLENPRVIAGLYHPNDGHIAPAGVTMAMVAGARALGAKVHQQTEVTGFRRRPSGEWEVQTNQGSITCDHVILATGNYARQTGAMLGLDIPAIPILHQYWTTAAVPEIVARKAAGQPELPILRDEEFNGYIREEGDGLMFGPYERPEHLKLFALDGVPEWFGADLVDEDFAAVEPQWEAAINSVPMLGRAGIRANVRGPFQMTADEMPLCGPAWGLENIWLAEGVPGGILWGGALGDALADWITTGTTPIDMSELDPRRFGAHCNKEWTRQSVIETWGTHADLRFPFAQGAAGRPGKTVPGHEVLDAAGAAWGVDNGWEVPMWYAPDGPRTAAASFHHGPEHALIGAEAQAVRTGLGLIDQTAMAKFEVTGPGAAGWLDRMLATALPPDGSTAPALLLNNAGGVCADLRIARIGPVFYLTTAAREQRRAFDGLLRALPKDGSVHLADVTGAIGVLTLAGPRAREVMAKVTEAACDTQQMPTGRLVEASCGLVPGVRILCDGTCGEVAFELHHPMGFHRTLLNRLLALDPQPRLVGSRAWAALGREKARPAMGAEMNPSRPALQSGLGGLIDLTKDQFIGRDAVLDQKAAGVAQRLVPLRVLTRDASLRGDETVWQADKPVGRITSGGWSWQAGHDLALALLPAGIDPAEGLLSVTVLGEACPAQMLTGPAYDPEDSRLTA